MRQWVFVTFVAFLAMGLTGCGGPGHVSVTGQITLKGKPIQGTEDAPISVSLCPIVDDKDQFEKLVTAEVNQADGTFTVASIPAGKARIAVTQTDRNSLEDRLGDRFTEGDSPIVRDLAAGQKLTIDLANPDG